MKDDIPYDVLVERLTRSHEMPIQTDEGPTSAPRDALLKQLRDAVFGGTDRGGVAVNKSKMPLNAAALDLYNLIDRQVAEVWGVEFAGIPGAETTERMLAVWAAKVDPFTIVRYSSPETIRKWSPQHREQVEQVIWTKVEASPYILLSRWYRAITELFDPPRLMTNPAPCVACGARESHRRVDGQTVRSTALVIEVDRITNRPKEVRCLVCGTAWGPELFEWLNRAIEQNAKRHADSFEQIDETTSV